MASFFVENFGCRATQADGAAIERQLLEKGLARGSSAIDAEVVVLNTCTVTASADQDARAAIRRIKRGNPEARIIVTGCYAQRAPEEISRIEGVSLVVGNSHKHALPTLAANLAPKGFVSVASIGVGTAATEAAPVVIGDIFAHTELMAAPVFDSESAAERTRPNLKIQDGCNNRCSFCVIPYVRGKSRSLTMDSVLHEVDSLVEAGYKEIVLSGINLGRWGNDLRPRVRFEELVRNIVENTAIPKVRISSVEPMDWSNELIALVAESPKICKHAHAPLQSGSDRILRKMHRRYRPWHYADRLERIRTAMPQAAIGADVMVGFPGETDEHFEETRSFIESLPFTYLHVFTYSSRPGTPSAAMAEQVPVYVARERNKVLRDLIAEKKHGFMESLVGKEIEAVTLTNQRDGMTEALTDNYQKAMIAGEHTSNQLVRVRLDRVDGESLLGVITSVPSAHHEG
ncbi:tRNA (N(6)-L-threonylcarbamoyladenosine(37)-C(2))-methylthiotransferase MtaB [Candidatus Korobacter versatilis]|uniref:tRNA (N(6)-L-threonylcarbamoyladenosine(37)-C(2))- methylthiotransferase MtaB n=1 Tax=Candidatus Korobacter versatilis TaxID=658062 RepID=UPI000310AA00|nr:tRNA (N(6)-L-threonylcarbamoyladenosine(37)-C(2))-methylthiotransferase MtaB [Candidatus Koribacter versatilis]